MGTEVSKVKQILRGQMRQALAELSDQERAWSDGELIQRFLDHPKLAQAQTVMLYYGVGHEIRTEGLIQTLLDQGKTVCLPKCLPENQMEMCIRDSLEPAGFPGEADPRPVAGLSGLCPGGAVSYTHLPGGQQHRQFPPGHRGVQPQPVV